MVLGLALIEDAAKDRLEGVANGEASIRGGVARDVGVAVAIHRQPKDHIFAVATDIGGEGQRALGVEAGHETVAHALIGVGPPAILKRLHEWEIG